MDAMHALLIWVMVNLVHPNPYAAGYAFPTLAACQHAMNVFALSSQSWACRSIAVLPDTTAPVPELSQAMQDRGCRNATYNETRLHALIAPYVQRPH